MKFLPLSYNVDYLSNICVVLGGYAVILGRMTRIIHVVSMHILLWKCNNHFVTWYAYYKNEIN